MTGLRACIIALATLLASLWILPGPTAATQCQTHSNCSLGVCWTTVLCQDSCGNWVVVRTVTSNTKCAGGCDTPIGGFGLPSFGPTPAPSAGPIPPSPLPMDVNTGASANGSGGCPTCSAASSSSLGQLNPTFPAPPPLDTGGMQRAAQNGLSPVQVGTGTLLYTSTDLKSPGPGTQFELIRYYNQLPSLQTPLSTAPYQGPMGTQWGHSYHWLLTAYDTAGDVRILKPDLTALDFTHSTAGYATTTSSVAWSLTAASGSGYTLEHRLRHLKIQFNAQGHAVAVVDRSGNTDTLGWAPASMMSGSPLVLSTITAASGLAYNFHYTNLQAFGGSGAPQWTIDSITEAVTGRKIQYSYVQTQGANYLYQISDSGTGGGPITCGYSSLGGVPGSPLVLTSVTDHKGNLVWEQSFDANGRVVSQTEDSASPMGYAYDDSAHTVRKTYPDGSSATVGYNAAGKITSLVDAAGASFRYGYDASQNLTSYTDGGGNTSTLAYDAGGALTQYTRPDNSSTTLGYDASENLISQTDFSGHTTRYERDAAGNITARVDPAGGREQWTYDAHGQIATYSDKRGNVWTYGHNASGQLTSITDPLGSQQRFELDARWRITASIDAGGQRTTYAYDAASRLTQVTNPMGFKRTFTYDADSNLSASTNWNGQATTYTYGSTGAPFDQPRMIQTPVASNTLVYDSQGRMIADGGDPGRQLTYDSVGHMIRTTDLGSGGGTVLLSYTPDSRLASRTDREGRVTRFAYNSVGQLVRTTFPDGATESREYDADGLLSAITNPGGGRSINVHDTLHRLVSVTDPSGRATLYSYDAAGNTTGVILPGGQAWHYTYDALSRISTVTDPAGGVTTYAYSCPCGKPTRITNARGNAWSLAYDAMGRKISETDPLGAVWRWTYDGDGNVLTETDPSGAVKTYTYDAGDRLVSILYSDGTAVALTYSGGTRLVATEQDASTRQAYVYDGMRHLLSASTTALTTGTQVARTLYYTYNREGAALRVSEGQTTGADGVGWTRDARDRVIQVSETSGGSVYVTSVTRSADGWITSICRPNAVATQMSYTPSGEIATVTHRKGSTLIGHVALCRDANGNIVSSTMPSGVIRYGYDVLNRLTDTVGPVETEHFDYDAVGNVTRHASSIEGSTTFTLDAADRIAQSSDGATYAYDARGDLSSYTLGSTSFAYHYNGAGRLGRIDQNGSTLVTYTYYPRVARLRAREVPGQPKQYYLLDRENVYEDLIEMTGQPGVTMPTARYASLGTIDGLLSRRDLTTGGVGYLLWDQIHSTQFVTDASGSVVNTYTYSSFGEGRTASESAPMRYRFAQREAEPGTGLYFLRNRFYAPSLARFIAPDPLGLIAGIDRYLYVADSPIGRIDPLGLIECQLIGNGNPTRVCVQQVSGSAQCTSDGGTCAQYGLQCDYYCGPGDTRQFILADGDATHTTQCPSTAELP